MSWKTFIEGMGSVFNLFPSPPKPPKSLLEKDLNQIIKEDWEAVGNDFKTVMKDIDQYLK